MFSVKYGRKKIVYFCVFCILCLLSFRGLAAFAAGQDAPGSEADNELRSSGALSWKDYNGKRIGVLTGTLMEAAANTYFPDSEHLYFNSYPDLNVALLSGKIDAYIGDEPNLKTLHREIPEIDYIRERIQSQDVSFAFRKGDAESAALCRELNEFLKKSWEDGTMQEIDDIWMGIDEEK